MKKLKERTKLSISIKGIEDPEDIENLIVHLLDLEVLFLQQLQKVKHHVFLLQDELDPDFVDDEFVDAEEDLQDELNVVVLLGLLHEYCAELFEDLGF